MSKRPPDELVNALTTAREAVEEANIPEDLREIAFAQAFKAVWESSDRETPKTKRHSDIPTGLKDPSLAVHGDLIPKIAAGLGIESSALAKVFSEDNGELILAVKRASLGTNKAAAIRQVAMLVVVGRQLAGLEEYTPLKVVREECRELKVFDEKNFAATVDTLEFRTKGARNSKQVKALRHHIDDTAEAVQALIGE